MPQGDGDRFYTNDSTLQVSRPIALAVRGLAHPHELNCIDQAAAGGSFSVHRTDEDEPVVLHDIGRQRNSLKAFDSLPGCRVRPHPADRPNCRFAVCLFR